MKRSKINTTARLEKDSKTGELRLVKNGKVIKKLIKLEEEQD